MIGIGPCGHKDVCHCCHMKQRILFDDKACCMCKVRAWHFLLWIEGISVTFQAKSETIIITPPTEESYSVLSSKCFEKSDGEHIATYIMWSFHSPPPPFFFSLRSVLFCLS